MRCAKSLATQCATYLETIDEQAEELKVKEKISSTKGKCLMRLENGRKEESYVILEIRLKRLFGLLKVLA